MSASSPAVGNLEVTLVEGREEELLPTTSTRYRITEAIIDLALALLETPEGKQGLADVATAIIQERDNTPGSLRRRPPHIYRDSVENMPFWIDRFLRCMRRNFPPVFIKPTDGEAAAVKRTWGKSMEDYQAGGDAGHLEIRDSIISNMVYARQQTPDVAGDSYSHYKFQMVVSVAHEIVHFLTGFITGTAVPHTPPGVIAQPFPVSQNNGEAGRYWERELLGGFLEMWSVPDDPLELRQPGEPFLFLSGPLQDSTGMEVSLSYIHEFLEGRFSFPIRTTRTARPIKRSQLKRAGRLETSTIRGGPKFRKVGRVDSPAPRGPEDGPELRFRSLPAAPVSGYSGSGGGYSGSRGGYSGSASGYSSSGGGYGGSGGGYSNSGGGYSGSGGGYGSSRGGYSGSGNGGGGYSRPSYR
ncbi:hypothetical protein F5144DRAFT_479665 [Chaetomium tenue]|uniref:Uncharacterized protein n=1 Tax=Chaetomium tenue TaxID=1854479 RepID=A0ACB7PNF1_9PEZI|nr:hypothetical protein F5144DRAFT_479665 [Chaetomium globosum]